MKVSKKPQFLLIQIIWIVNGKDNWDIDYLISSVALLEELRANMEPVIIIIETALCFFPFSYYHVFTLDSIYFLSLSPFLSSILLFLYAVFWGYCIPDHNLYPIFDPIFHLPSKFVIVHQRRLGLTNRWVTALIIFLLKLILSLCLSVYWVHKLSERNRYV